MYRFLFRTLFIFFPVIVQSQAFNYVHYDTKEGLPSSTVYDMCEDSDGFIWFATPNGLSRFDGTSFKNFTVKDGLPDNEVLKIFPDSKGRLWIGTFSKAICFYYKGKIYNERNSGWLSKIKLRNAALNFAEDDAGTFLISDTKRLTEVKDTMVRILTEDAAFDTIQWSKITAIGHSGGGFIIGTLQNHYHYSNGKLKLIYRAQADLNTRIILMLDSSGAAKEAFSPDTRLGVTPVRNKALFVSTINGSWLVDTLTYAFTTHFLPGKKISKTIKDREGSVWFSTLLEGVYRLPSEDIRNANFPKQVRENEVISITGSKNLMVCGLNFSQGIVFDDKRVAEIFDYANQTQVSINNTSTNRLVASCFLDDGTLLLGFDAFLTNRNRKGNLNIRLFAIKSIDTIDSKRALIGTSGNAYIVSTTDLQVVDTVFRGRTTKVLNTGKAYYIGTLEGLFVVDARTLAARYLGTIDNSLSRRVTDMTAGPNGTIWVATNDAGIVGYRDGKIIRKIQEQDGLSSNICKTLFRKKNFLYVGTNKGLNRVDLSNHKSILKYSASDGLPSDIINALYVSDSMVYIGTPKGLTFFNEDAVSNLSICNLKILDVSISGRGYPVSSKYTLPYDQNNISFHFVGISYKSGGDIQYHYKLNGLDTAWQTTRENRLVYQTLPYGEYSLQLYAVNKFGVVSDRYTINFLIKTPFWRSRWAFLISVLLLISATALVVSLRNKSIQKKLIEKNNLQKQFAALEQQALQAQMNPHFIFNCLNSIQQYMLTNDREKANQYLTGFASLIRRTLHISGKQSIKVNEEIQFLKGYLDMEKMRFGESFHYDIVIDKTVETDLMEMPALLLQPFVENCLRHGIRHKQDGTGHVLLSFRVTNEILFCTIRDNGIGRSKAALYKGRQHIEYQSKGMSLTEKRVDLINKINDQKISIEIIDLKDASGNDSGTEVIVQIPV